MQSIRSAVGKIPHVAIVGAGFSGLRCAEVLIRSGVKVTIFEARDRIGGRVHQLLNGGHLVDMGPNWIHGTSGNPIMRLAQATNTLVLEPEEDEVIFAPDGSRRSDDESAELAATIWGMIVDAFKYSDENSATIDKDLSLYEYFKQQLTKKAQSKADHDKIAALLYESQMWGPFVGDPVERQSLKFFFLEECIDSENVFVASTYKNILASVGKVALEQADIQFNQEVIHYELLPQQQQDSHRVALTTKAGTRHTFDDVVITCPLGWLKRNQTNAFKPALPLRLSQAINNINYGRLEKLYISFPTAWWLHQQDSDSTVTSTSYHFHDPNYVPHPSNEPWNQTLVSLAHLPAPANHPTLLFYIYGPCATTIVNSTSAFSTNSPEYMAHLTAFSQPFFSRLPNYNHSSPSCKPTSLLLTNWQLDRFAGNGSYCNFPVGLEAADLDIETMRNAGGLTSQGLWLAGEHTAPFVALGTSTGAWWSGEGVARRICASYGRQVPLEEGELKEKVNALANGNGVAVEAI